MYDVYTRLAAVPMRRRPSEHHDYPLSDFNGVCLLLLLRLLGAIFASVWERALAPHAARIELLPCRELNIMIGCHTKSLMHVDGNELQLVTHKRRSVLHTRSVAILRCRNQHA